MGIRPIIDLDLRIAGTAPRFTLSATRRDPASAGETELLSETPLALDLEALRATENDPLAYGRLLGSAIFATPAVWTATAAHAAGREADLRLRLRITESAAELHALRWERLCDPDGSPIAAGGRVALLRFIPSRNPQPIPTPTLNSLRALVAVACPTDAERFRLPAFDADAEHERALQALADAPWIASLAPDAPAGRATPARLNELMRRGCDLLYLVCHGTIGPSGEPVLWLEQEDGRAARLSAGDLIRQFDALDETHRPLMVILAVCHSAGGEDAVAATAALGPQLARAGIPAVLAMQGLTPVDLVGHFVPTVLQELFKHCSIDRAVAAARANPLLDEKWWLPVLYTRVEDGRLCRDDSPPVATPLAVAISGEKSSALQLTLAARGLPPATDITGADAHLLHVTPSQLSARGGLAVATARLRQEVAASRAPALVVREGVSQTRLSSLVSPKDLGWAEIELAPAADQSALRGPATTLLDLALDRQARQRIRGGVIGVGLFTEAVAEVDPPPALLLDWTPFYANGRYPPPEVWRDELLPALADLYKVLKGHGVRQIDLTARARLGAGLSFGYAFRQVTETVIRVRQGPTWWRTVLHNPRLAPFGEVEPAQVGDGPDLTVELNVNRDPAEVRIFVESYLAANPLPIGRRLRLDRIGGPSNRITETEAQGMAAHVRTLIQRHRRPGGDVHLFMAAPLGLAVLIGWHLNGLTPVQYYELPQGARSYEPSSRLVAL